MGVYMDYLNNDLYFKSKYLLHIICRCSPRPREDTKNACLGEEDKTYKKSEKFKVF